MQAAVRSLEPESSELKTKAALTVASKPLLRYSDPTRGGVLQPVAAVDAQRVKKLLADLDSERFAVRDAATKELTAMGEQLEPALRRVLESKPSLEVRNRVQAIQASLRGVPSIPTLRTLRAIRALEDIGTTEARQILRKLADGATGARETREANKALDRLALRRSPGR